MLPLSAALLLAPTASGQEDPFSLIESERTDSLDLAARDLLDPDPSQHLGWGTLEDVFIDLGGGAGVSLLSGNVVLRFEPLPRPNLPSSARMAFTYNHMDPEGAPDLAPGWTYTFARFWMPGPWGERVLIDSDGFNDHFWAGEPPSAQELDRVTRNVIGSWRRETPARARRALGGVRALEELLVSDPSTLGAMRLRYLGAPDPDLESDRIYRSSARGVRTFEDEGKDVVLKLPDGSREIYEQSGALKAIEPRAGADWAVARNNGVLDEVSVGGMTEWSVETDSRFRLSELKSASGGSADFEYGGSLLQRVESALGDWRFRYDERGRLEEATTPVGVVSIRYDDATGRVQSASGPNGSYQMRATLEDTSLRVAVDGLVGGTMDVSWDAERRQRNVTRGGTQVERVTFAKLAALPTDVELASGLVSFDWDDSGRLLRARQEGREVRFDRDAEGVLRAVVDAGGARGVVEASEDGLRGWSDPAGRRTTLERGDDGHIRAVGRTGGADLSLQRYSTGALSYLSALQGPEIALPSPERAVGEVRFDGTSAGVRRDQAGRIVGFEGSTGRIVTLVLGAGGRVEQLRDDRTSASLTYTGSLLAGWTGPEGSRTVRRDGDGLPSGLIEGSASRWEVRRNTRGGVDRLLLDGVELIVETAADGAVRSWQRPGGARTTLERRGDGVVTSRDDTAHGTLGLDVDRAGRVLGVKRGSGRWLFARDRSGRIQRVAQPGGAVDFTLDDAGRPRSLMTTSGHSWSVRRDAVGRLTSIEGYGGIFSLEQTRSGVPRRFVRADGTDARLDFDGRGRWTGMGLPDGALAVSWGVLGPTGFGGLRWRLDSVGALSGWGPVEDGRLRWFADRGTDGRVRAVRGGVVERRIKRLPDGRPTLAGAFELDWSAAGLLGIAERDREWRFKRDGAGRVRRVDGPDSVLVIERERTGDARTLTVTDGRGEGSVEFGRDPAGRLETLALDGDLGRGTWTLTRDPMGRIETAELNNTRAEVTWRDIASDSGGVLAEALAVQTDDEALLRENSGSWDIEGVVGGAAFSAHQSRPTPGGRHDQASFLPEAVRLGLPPAALRGVKLGLPQPIEPPQSLDGDAARARRWWLGRAPRVERLALMPEGLPESVRAWREARSAAIDVAAGLPEDVAHAGAGVLLPAVPGSSALVPGPIGARRVSATEALVLSGDLSAEALVWNQLLGLPEDSWTFDLPGAALLAALRPRLADPTLPPEFALDSIAAVQAGAHGLLTRRGRDQERRRSWDVHSLTDGLPPGTAEVLPGTPGWISAMPGTTAADGRATALDALSDDPLGAREADLGQARADSILLALQALQSETASSLSGTLPDSAAAESWLIELPSGTRVVLDGRGRLLSIDAGGRLMRSLVGRMAGVAAQELLAPTLDRWGLTSAEDDSPWNPPFLPGRGEAVESRWGLVPAAPALPIDFQGRPALPFWPR